MRLTREDWLERSLEVLAHKGPEHLKIDRLCVELGVTKGSFYHYFGNRAQYVDDLLDYWQERNTRKIIESVEQIAALPKRSLALSDITQSVDTKPEVAIRAWALYEPKVAQKLAEVDSERINYLSHLIAGQLSDASQAPLIAKLVYAHFVGVQQLGSQISAKEWRAMDELLRGLLANPEA